MCKDGRVCVLAVSHFPLVINNAYFVAVLSDIAATSWLPTCLPVCHTNRQHTFIHKCVCSCRQHSPTSLIDSAAPIASTYHICHNLDSLTSFSAHVGVCGRVKRQTSITSFAVATLGYLVSVEFSTFDTL